MLVHKATMGVLGSLWTGEYKKASDGALVPAERPARLDELPELDPADWWEVPDGAALARRIKRGYPWLKPVTGPAGELLDVVPTHTGKPEKTAARDQEALRRGYRQAGRVRPLGIFGFLEVSKRTTNRGRPAKSEDEKKE